MTLTKKLPGWLIALSTLLVVSVACASGDSGDATQTTSTTVPTAQETPTADSERAGVATTQPGEVSPELAAYLEEIDRRMAAIREIPVADPVPFRFLDDDAINAYVREQIDDPETVEDIGNSEMLYKLLGLIDADSSLFDQYAALLDAQVLGAYDPEEEEFVVRQPGGEFGASQEFTYAHEYIHRLQDAKFGLDEIIDGLEGNSDRTLAFSALIEGDATTAQQIYALRHLDFEQLTEILAESQEAAAGSRDAPYILQTGLEFPYIEGASFVDSLRSAQGVAGVDAAFANPPDSTEQILHFEKYLNREVPDEVALPEMLFSASGPLGAGWSIVDEDVMGEFFLRAWLEAIGARSTDAAEAAAGWGGDALTLASSDDGDHAVAARIVWDDGTQDAEQFFLVLTTIMAASPEFRRVDIGPDIGIRAYEADGGVIVVGTFNDEAHGQVTAFAAATELQDAMPLVLSLSG